MSGTRRARFSKVLSFACVLSLNLQNMSTAARCKLSLVNQILRKKSAEDPKEPLLGSFGHTDLAEPHTSRPHLRRLSTPEGPRQEHLVLANNQADVAGLVRPPSNRATLLSPSTLAAPASKGRWASSYPSG